MRAAIRCRELRIGGDETMSGPDTRTRSFDSVIDVGKIHLSKLEVERMGRINDDTGTFDPNTGKRLDGLPLDGVSKDEWRELEEEGRTG